MSEIVCPNCNYTKATEEIHPNEEKFLSCSRCGYWRKWMSKENNSESIKDTNSFIEETDEYYIVGGGGKGSYRIEKGDELSYVGSLDRTNFDIFEQKINEMFAFNKIDKVTYTEKQLGVWFEIDYRTREKKVIED